MVTDYVYKYLSDEIYKIENDKQNYAENKEIFDSGGNNIAKRNKYKILALEDNQNNGMQAMAVAPVNDRGEVDTSKIEHEFQTIDGVGSSIFFDKKYDIIIKNRRRNNEKSHKNRVNYNGNIVCDARCNALV
ncbi:hypothetical protein [Gemella morbillorum]|uniref:hypothetical protein n=1 Tax=Gemella morbillorum TaxID=29391 RepID=UPI0028D6AE1B|nr:hypothetical protein [Gemella morbillorum]